MDKTLRELIGDLLENEHSVQSELFRSEVPDDFEVLLDMNNVQIEHANNFGGEDQGSSYWSVWKFTRGTESIYVKFNGWYASHYGSEYTGFSFVEPAQKTITVYE